MQGTAATLMLNEPVPLLSPTDASSSAGVAMDEAPRLALAVSVRRQSAAAAARLFCFFHHPLRCGQREK
jgi:hypothetical protein